MFKSLKKAKKGFTIIELLIVIAIIAILAGLVLNNFQGAQAKARDTQRVTDVNNIHSKLEEYHNENGFYPETIAAATITTLFPGIDKESAVDPRGSNIASQTAVANAAALNSTSPGTGTTANYHYTPYGCTNTECIGYQLKTGIEKPSTTTPNPYIKIGLNNN